MPNETFYMQHFDVDHKLPRVLTSTRLKLWQRLCCGFAHLQVNDTSKTSQGTLEDRMFDNYKQFAILIVERFKSMIPFEMTYNTLMKNINGKSLTSTVWKETNRAIKKDWIPVYNK